MHEGNLRAYWDALRAMPLAGQIENAGGVLESVDSGGAFLPAVVHTTERAVSNVCSLRAHYIDYAREELARLPQLSAPLRLTANAGLRVLHSLAETARLDDIVTVNNLLLTTCLYPALPAGAATQMTAQLRERHPGRAIAWRSLVPELQPELIAELTAAGAVLLPWRHVYLSSPAVLKSALLTSRDAARDVALARQPKAGYRWSEAAAFSAEDWERAAALFRQLYQEKYSRHNPAYTAAYFQLAQASRAFRMIGLRSPEGTLDGMVGLYRARGVQAAPFLGYDLGKPRERALYRQLCAKHWLEAMNDGCWAHQSAGAATFKKNRGAQPAIEYIAIFNRHLSWKRRAAWAAFIQVIRHVAVPVTRRYEQ